MTESEIEILKLITESYERCSDMTPPGPEKESRTAEAGLLRRAIAELTAAREPTTLEQCYAVARTLGRRDRTEITHVFDPNDGNSYEFRYRSHCYEEPSIVRRHLTQEQLLEELRRIER